MSLAHRTVISASWNISVSILGIGVLFARSVLLARLLPVDVFGVYAGAISLLVILALVPSFGMGGAFLHRAAETQDEETAAAVHFTLKILFTAAWVAVMLPAAMLLATGPTRTALLVLTVTMAVEELAQTPRLMLMRRVVHRRLAVLQLLDILLTTGISVGLALMGAGLWALLATDVVGAALSVALLYLWRPVWHPRLAWVPSVIKYYLSFGSRNFVAGVLLRSLDELDDLWTRVYLGATALGYYSRAFTFATYPRRILAAPINLVAGGTYAELKDERQRLSQAFFRSNAFLVRSGFLLAGILALVAPEFIRLVLGDRWLPMLEAFRLMLVFTMLDPLRHTISDLFVAVGKPEQVLQVRLVQLGLLIAGLVILGPPLGIAGVALAVNVMLAAGIVILLWQAQRYVDFSSVRMFLVPSLALLLGLGAGSGAALLLPQDVSDWQSGLVKMMAFGSAYLVVLLALEYRTFVDVSRPVIHILRSRTRHLRPGP